MLLELLGIARSGTGPLPLVLVSMAWLELDIRLPTCGKTEHARDVSTGASVRPQVLARMRAGGSCACMGARTLGGSVVDGVAGNGARARAKARRNDDRLGVVELMQLLCGDLARRGALATDDSAPKFGARRGAGHVKRDE